LPMSPCSLSVTLSNIPMLHLRSSPFLYPFGVISNPGEQGGHHHVGQ
jgi:hypothetical protein